MKSKLLDVFSFALAIRETFNFSLETWCHLKNIWMITLIPSPACNLELLVIIFQLNWYQMERERLKWRDYWRFKIVCYRFDNVTWVSVRKLAVRTSLASYTGDTGWHTMLKRLSYKYKVSVLLIFQVDIEILIL